MKRSLAILLPILAVALYASIARVPEGELAVARKDGAAQVLGPGWHLRVPFAAPLTKYPSRPSAAADSTLLTFRDGTSYAAGFDIAGRIDAAGALAFDAAARDAGTQALFTSVGTAALAAAAAKAPPVDLASGALQTAASALAARALGPRGVTEVSIKIKALAAPECLKLAQALAGDHLAGLVRDTASALAAAPRAGWEAYTAMGLVLESEKDVHGAEKEYLDALTLSPGALPPMAQLVAIYSAVGEFSKLDRLLEAGIQAQPSSIQHLGWYAMSLLRQKRLTESEKMIVRALAIEPANVLLLNNLGGVQMQQGHTAEAIATFRKAAAAKPGDRQSAYNLGVALCADGKDSDGLPFLLEAEGAGAPAPVLLDAIARAYRKTGDTRRAREYEGRASSARRAPAPHA
ncbi:MAG: tetratricopeptide repeat protein [Acidobacteria bacterium]|nr:tetratricopeptide repeat protein [Acidobacteriota bacterium]